MNDINMRRRNFTKQDAMAYSELMKELGNAQNAAPGSAQPTFNPALQYR